MDWLRRFFTWKDLTIGAVVAGVIAGAAWAFISGAFALDIFFQQGAAGAPPETVGHEPTTTGERSEGALVSEDAAWSLESSDDESRSSMAQETPVETEGTELDTRTRSDESSAKTPPSAASRPSPTPRPVSVLPLTDENDVDENYCNAGAENINGLSYGDATYFSDEGWCEYDLSRDFQRFTATLGWADDSAADSTGTFRVTGDGEILFQKVIALGQAIPVDLDVSQVLRLRVEVTDSTASSYGSAAFGHPRAKR